MEKVWRAMPCGFPSRMYSTSEIPSLRCTQQLIIGRILPAVKKNIQNAPMVMAFLVGMFSAGENGGIDRNIALTIYKDVISDLTGNFSLQSLGAIAASVKKQATNYGSTPSLPPPFSES